MTLNVNGLRARSEELRPLLSKCFLAALQDTRCSDLRSVSLLFPQFYCYGCPARPGVPGNILLVHRDTRHDFLGVHESLGQSLVQVRLRDGSTGLPASTVVSSMYAPPPRRHGVLSQSLLALASAPERCIVLGDLNARHSAFGAQSPNANGRVLFSHLTDSNLVLMNDPSVPTFVHSAYNYTSCLDYVIVSPGLVSRFLSCLVSSDVGSDHLPLLARTRAGRPDRVSPPPGWHLTRDTDYGPFRAALDEALDSSVLWPPSSVRSPAELELRHATLVGLLRSAASRTLPPRRPPCPSRPRLPPETLVLIRSRRAMKRAYIAAPSTQLRHAINVLSRSIRREIREVKRRIESDRLDIIASGPSHPAFWQAIRRRFSPRTPGLTPIRSQSDPGRSLTHPEEVIQAFGEALHHLRPAPGAPPSSAPSAFPRVSEGEMPLVPPLSAESLLAILRRVRKNRAPGPDGVPYELLCGASPRFHLVLAQFLSDVLGTGYFPTLLLQSDTVMIPKPGKDPSLPTSYRPITLANCLLKVAEFHINKHVLARLERTHFLQRNQLAFRPGCSTVDQLVDVVEGAVTSFNLGEVTLLLSLDLHHAFDTVDHTQLLRLTDSALPCSRLHHLISALLCQRTTRIRIAGRFGPPLVADRGVPQGSPLSPTLFNVLMATAPQPVSARLRQYCYADDVTVTATASSPVSAWSTLAPHLDQLTSWMDRSHLQLQPAKTQALLLTRNRNRVTLPQVSIGGRSVPILKTARVLGVVLDRSLNFTPHLRRLAGDCALPIHNIRYLLQLNPQVPRSVGLLLHRTLVQSRLAYAAPLLLTMADSSWRRLEQVFNHSLRAATRSPRRTPIEELRRRARCPSFRDQYAALSTRVLLKYSDRQNSLVLRHLSRSARNVTLAFTCSPLRWVYLSLPHSLRVSVDRTLAHMDLRPP